MASDLGGADIVLAVVIALAYLLTAAHFLHLAWVWLRPSSLKRGSILGDISKRVAEARVWALGRGSRQESGLDSKIRILIQRERSRYIQAFARPFAHVSALFLAFRMITDILVATNSAEPSAVVERFALKGFSRVEGTVLIFVLCKLALTFPARLTSRTISAVFVLTCAVEVALSLFLLPLNSVIVEQPMSQGVLLILGIIVCDSRLTATCHLLVRLTVGIFLRRQALGAVEGDPLFGMSRRVVVQNIFLGIGQGLAFVCLESAVWTAAREVLVGKKTAHTARRIISALCDAVVTLGPDLKISKRAPKLANLLLRSSAAGALEGTSFSDLLLESDKARFGSFLERILDAEDEDEVADEPTPAQALQVSLRDGNGTGVTVQLFHSCFRNEDDEIGHILGICEVGDAPRGQAPCPQLDAGREEPGRMRGSAARVGGGSDLDSGSESSSTLGSISVTSRRARRAAAAAAMTRIARRAVAGSAGHGRLQSAREPAGEEPPESWQLLRPQECGVAFEGLRFQVGGQQRPALPAIDASLTNNDSLQSWVLEWPSCQAWLQDLTNAALRPIRLASWRDPGNPPAFVRLHVAFQATCAVPPDFLHRPLPDGGGAQRPPMRLPLTSMRLLKSAPRGAPRAADLPGGQQQQSLQSSVQPTVIGGATAPPEGRAGAAAAEEGPESRAARAYVCL